MRLSSAAAHGGSQKLSTTSIIFEESRRHRVYSVQHAILQQNAPMPALMFGIPWDLTIGGA